jgi:NADPH-dependent 7-cyano-7-deazaguanine reductase QueF
MSDNGNGEESFVIDTIKYEVENFDQDYIQIVSYGPVVTMAFCAVTYVPFAADVSFEYIPNGKLVEFESFDEWLGKELPTEPHTIESMGLRIFSALLDALGDIPLAVNVIAKTTVHGPAETEVRTHHYKET